MPDRLYRTDTADSEGDIEYDAGPRLLTVTERKNPIMPVNFDEHW